MSTVYDARIERVLCNMEQEGLSQILVTSTAVSYTHLDVYKRQSISLPATAALSAATAAKNPSPAVPDKARN